MRIDAFYMALRYLNPLLGWWDILEIIENKIILIDRNSEPRANWKLKVIKMDNLGLILSVEGKTWAETNGAYQDRYGDEIEQEMAERNTFGRGANLRGIQEFVQAVPDFDTIPEIGQEHADEFDPPNPDFN